MTDSPDKFGEGVLNQRSVATFHVECFLRCPPSLALLCSDCEKPRVLAESVWLLDASHPCCPLFGKGHLFAFVCLLPSQWQDHGHGHGH